MLDIYKKSQRTLDQLGKELLKGKASENPEMVAHIRKKIMNNLLPQFDERVKNGMTNEEALELEKALDYICKNVPMDQFKNEHIKVFNMSLAELKQYNSKDLKDTDNFRHIFKESNRFFFFVDFYFYKFNLTIINLFDIITREMSGIL